MILAIVISLLIGSIVTAIPMKIAYSNRIDAECETGYFWGQMRAQSDHECKSDIESDLILVG